MTATRFVALDIHKDYVVLTAITKDFEQVLPFKEMKWHQFEKWAPKHLDDNDSVVLEATTNAWTVYDLLVDHVHSVTIVHPGSVPSVTQAKVKTDKKAAMELARLHAAGLTESIWIPPQEIRDLRSLVKQRAKLVDEKTRAKNRLHAILHAHHLKKPKDMKEPFHEKNTEWWLALPVSSVERVIIEVQLETIRFVEQQIARIEEGLNAFAAESQDVQLLVQVTGIRVVLATAIVAAVGDITRFPSAKKLVGYAGLGAKVHSSGDTHRTGGITKTGRRDLRKAMVTAATNASRNHPHWKHVYERLAPRIGEGKARVAVARKMLVSIWYIWTHHEADKFAKPEQVASSYYQFAYNVGVERLGGVSARQFTSNRLHAIGLRKRLEWFPKGKAKRVTLPPPD